MAISIGAAWRVANRRRTSAALAVCATLSVSTHSAPIFEYVSEGAPVEHRGISRGVAWGDYDGDGDADLYVTHPTYDGPVQHNALYRNDGGRFSEVDLDPAPPAGWEGSTWVDADGDGDLDLHVVGRGEAGSLFYENGGHGRLALRAEDPLGGLVRSASMACWADADGDGRLDVFVAGYREGRNELFRGLGSWRFEPVPLPERGRGHGEARACAWGDLDGDGLPELVVANARAPNQLLRNRGAMELVPDSSTGLEQDTAYGYGVSFADTNGDGLRDLFVANFDAGNSLYLGRADGGLARVPLRGALESAASKGHAWGDYDLDGREDLYLGSGTAGPDMVNRLYLAQEDGGYRLDTAGEVASHADTSAAVAAADYDGDGDLDLFVANWGGEGSLDRLYRNTTSGRGWLKVRLEGVRSNRMAIGARVSILLSSEGGSRWLHRWLDAATGYAGQNEPVVHFGLGMARGADSVVVAWPSGTRDDLGATPGNATILVREGSGTAR